MGTTLFLTKIVFTLTLIFLISSSLYSSEKEKSKYKCAYELEIQNDTIKQKYTIPETYIVQINDDITKGFTYKKFHNDSLMKANSKLRMVEFNAYLNQHKEAMNNGDYSALGEKNPFNNGSFTSTLYKDYKKNEMRIVDNVSTHTFVFTDELQPQNWEIQTDTMTILGYHSQKATCQYRGRDWIAWFTSEIPMSEGPWKFYGLPGLITKVADDKEHYSFTLTGFQEIEELIDIEISKKAEKTKRKEFIKTMKGGQLYKADMEKVGLPVSSKDEDTRAKYDYIETDYKEWGK